MSQSPRSVPAWLSLHTGGAPSGTGSTAGTNGPAGANISPGANSSAGATGSFAADTLSLSLHEHGVGFFLPPLGVLHSSLFTLPHGALIEGEVVGDVTCEAGSIIVSASARVYGSLIADRIYIEGTVGSRRNERSVLTGRLLIAAGATSRINADLRSRSWSLHAGAKVWGTVSTIEDGAIGGASRE